MTRKHHVYDRRTGREVDDDEALDQNGTLRDGFSLRVPLTMADSMTPLQRAVAADSAARGTDKILRRATRAEITTDAHSYVVDAFGNTDFHRPGSRFLQTGHRTVDYARQETLQVMRDDAYRLHDAEESRRWQGVDGQTARSQSDR